MTARTTIEELKKNRRAAMTADERAVFDETCEAGSTCYPDASQSGPCPERSGQNSSTSNIRPTASQATSVGSVATRQCDSSMALEHVL